DRTVRPTPRELTPSAMAVSTLDRFSASIAPGGRRLERFLGTGPIRHPRYRLFAADLRRLLAGPVPPEVAAREIRLVVDGITEYFFTGKGSIRKRWPQYTSA